MCYYFLCNSSKTILNNTKKGVSMNSKLNLVLGLALSFATSNSIDVNSMRVLGQPPTEFKEREVDFDLINSVINDNLFCAEQALKNGANPNVKVEFDTCNPVCTPAEFSDQAELQAQNLYDVVDNAGACSEFEKQKRYGKFSWQGREFQLYLITGAYKPSYTYPIFIGIKSADMARLLIDYGADVHQKEPAGNTPLQSSVVAGAVDTMHALISAGADIHARICMGPECGESLLDCALGILMLCGYPQLQPGLEAMKQMVSELLRLGVSPIYHAPKTPIEALIYAVMIGDQKTIAQYLTPCANVNVNEIAHRYTPLTMAVWLGRYDITKQLLEFSLTDVNKKDGKDETPLFLAVMRNDVPLVELLLQHGADTKPLLCREIDEFYNEYKYSKEIMNLIKHYNASEPCTEDFKKGLRNN